ncbi:polyhydroxyalkanoate biosynthesis repressor PhaR [Neobacillus pocheonensis]|uniref:polyhydroxyalkanoate biosynthesis repressor PhaR n=1 Tax=Neobacillus pocheonensis TaxID=363869 RepID=UPI003D27775F
MADQKQFDPYKAWQTYMLQWEKQTNEMIQSWTNNREAVKIASISSDIQARFLEMLQKNQQEAANLLNLPTKRDITNAAKLTIQTEEKLDALEELIWNLQDFIEASNNENSSIAKITSEMLKQMKQLKTEQKKESETVREIYSELQEIKRDLAVMNGLKEEIVSLKLLIAENTQKHERELVLTK